MAAFFNPPPSTVKMAKINPKYQYYYAVFEFEAEGKITVHFPDFDAQTAGANFDEALEMAVELLAMLLATTLVIPPKSSRDALKKAFLGKKYEIVPVFIDQQLIQAYSKDSKTRFNTSMFQSVLSKIDAYLPGSRFANRSQFLENAALFLIEFEKNYLDLDPAIFKELLVTPEASYQKRLLKQKKPEIHW